MTSEEEAVCLCREDRLPTHLQADQLVGIGDQMEGEGGSRA